MKKTCKTCINNDDGLCDRRGILVEDKDSCEKHSEDWKEAMLRILAPYLEERRCEMNYKNKEGYPDPTEGEAIRRASRMPTHIYNVSCALNAVAGLHGLDIMGLRDKKTGREWPQRR